MYRKYREVRQSELPEGELQVRCEKLRKRCTIFKRHPKRDMIVLQHRHLFTNQSQKLVTKTVSNLRFLNVRCVKWPEMACSSEKDCDWSDYRRCRSKTTLSTAHRWVLKRQSPIVSLQFSANQRRPSELPLTIGKSYHQPNHPAESTAPDDQPTQVFVDHLLNNVLYHFRCHFIQATINQVGHCLTD